MARKVYNVKFNRMFASYKKQYKIKKEHFKKMNRRYGWNKFTMREERLKKSDFYDAIKDYLNEIPTDEKNRNQTAIRRLVSDEAYSRTRKQYLGLVRNRQQIYEETGYELPKMSEAEFRSGDFFDSVIDWDKIKDKYHELIDVEKLESKEAAARISNLFFGSP